MLSDLETLLKRTRNICIRYLSLPNFFKLHHNLPYPNNREWGPSTIHGFILLNLPTIAYPLTELPASLSVTDQKIAHLSTIMCHEEENVKEEDEKGAAQWTSLLLRVK